MKKIYSILMILAVAAGFTNCSKADLVENKETEKGGTAVYATTDAATKTTLADDYKVLWSTGDQIKFVKDGATTTTYTFTLSSGEGTTSGTFTCAQTLEDGTYTVYYPATYDGTSWPAQTYIGATDISGAPMKATATVSGGSVSDISFKNEGGILRYTVKGSKTIKSINVKSGFTLDVTLSCGTSGVALTAEGTVFNIALPAGEYSNATLTFTATDNTVATKTASSFKVTKNKVSLAIFEATALSFLTDGALPGVFTVNADGKKVYFSRGNLYAKKTGDNWTWNFYDEQYKYNSIATNKGRRKVYDNDTEIDLFTWGYDNTSTNNSYFLNPKNSAGISGHTTSGETFSSLEDWGYVFGGESSVWRTLTSAEWQYLFNTRSNASNLYKCGVTVCGKTNCVVLLPDNWQWDASTVGTSWQSEYPETSTEGNPVVTWQTMQAAGAVCLPAAGYRQTSSVKDVGENGNYWSSTSYGEGNAYYVYFDSEYGVVPDAQAFRSEGYSVRLITDASVTPAPTPTTTGTAKATIGGSEVDVNWVQLWENGPKFAEMNLGATSATEVGDTYQFSATGENDNAATTWGDNWLTPSKDQMNELLLAAQGNSDSKVTCKIVRQNNQETGNIIGFKFTGKEPGYTGNSVFFPAKDGTSNYGSAVYWSATANGDEAWDMRLNCSNGNWSSYWDQSGRHVYYRVRPVLKN